MAVKALELQSLWILYAVVCLTKEKSISFDVDVGTHFICHLLKTILQRAPTTYNNRPHCCVRVQNP